MLMKPSINEILPQGYKMTELGALKEEWEVEEKYLTLEIKILEGIYYGRPTKPEKTANY